MTHPQSKIMSLGDHLDELRHRIFLGALAPVPLFIVVFAFSESLLALLLKPVHEQMIRADIAAGFQVLSPPEMLFTRVKLSFIGAIILSLPWILYQCWAFIAPGLYRHERRFVHVLIPGSTLLTVAGASFLYFILLPLAVSVLMMFTASFEFPDGGPRLDKEIAAVFADAATVDVVAVAPSDPMPGDAWLLLPEMMLQVAVPDDDPDADTAFTIVDVQRKPPLKVQQDYRLRDVVGFILTLVMSIAIAFQLPLVILVAGWVGIAKADWLAKKRRHALFFCGIAAAITTPQDVISMVIMLIPLYGLYEFGILLLRILPANRIASPDLGEGGESFDPGEKSGKPNADPQDGDSNESDRNPGGLTHDESRDVPVSARSDEGPASARDLFRPADGNVARGSSRSSGGVDGGSEDGDAGDDARQDQE